MKIAAIIPAYNEESRISTVLSVLMNCPQLNEIIVVSDGSSDNTVNVASKFKGVNVVALPANIGKGGAMVEGVKIAQSEIVLFLDADLIGLKPEHVSDIVKPVQNGEVEMSIGVFKGGRKITDWAQIITPYISGQRALLKSNFLDVPNLHSARYGVEVALTRYAKTNGIPFKTVPISGVTHPMKEEKLGLYKGAVARCFMYFEILKNHFCASYVKKR